MTTSHTPEAATREFPEPIVKDEIQHAPARVGTLDTILSNPRLGKRTRDEWYFARMEVMIPIQSVTSDEWKSANEASRTIETVGRSKQIYESQDMGTYQDIVVSYGVLEPNFRDPEQRKRIAQGADQPERTMLKDAVNLVFLPGEKIELTTAIAKLSGFADDEAKPAEEAVIDQVKH